MEEFTRYQRLFESSVYKEADAQGGGESLDDILGTPPTQDAGATDPNAAQPPTDDMGMEDMGMDEQEPSEEENEAEKEAEQELQGKISAILSDISDKLGPETLRYYQDVEATAIKHLIDMNLDKAELDEVFENMNDIGMKIVSSAKKNNFIDRDNICYLAILEGVVDIRDKVIMGKKPKKKKDETEESEKEVSEKDEES